MCVDYSYRKSLIMGYASKVVGARSWKSQRYVHAQFFYYCDHYDYDCEF